jgi:hypothetical protein
MKMKIFLYLTLAVLFLTVACSRGVVSPGNEIRGELPDKTHTLLDAWPQAGSTLFATGHPVQLDTYTEAHDISGSGIMVINVRSLDFSPLAAVIDGDGNLIAFSDSWKDGSNAIIVIDGAPSSGKLLVFSPDDTRGLYDVIVEAGTAEDLETFQAGSDFSDGFVNARIEEDADNSYLEDILNQALEEYVYNYNYSQAKLYPFTIDDEQLVSISLESDDFDTYLILLAIENGEYIFVDYNDDYSGSNSRILRELEAGDYLALVMPYSEGNSGEFTLSMESIDEEALEQVETEAQQQGIVYTADIVLDRNFALAWWPDIVENWEAPDFLNPFAPVAAFTFSVDNTSVYEINAHGDMDVCLTLLRKDGESMIYIASNDDYFDLGTDSRVVKPLIPGDYVAIVSPYSGTDEGEVSFSWSGSDSGISTLRPGSTIEVDTDFETESLIYRLNLQAGRDYSVYVESDDLDPVITLILPDGENLYDDDGGGGTNSLLNFHANEDQAGECFLIVEKYYSAEGTFTIQFEESSR